MKPSPEVILKKRAERGKDRCMVGSERANMQNEAWAHTQTMLREGQYDHDALHVAVLIHEAEKRPPYPLP